MAGVNIFQSIDGAPFVETAAAVAGSSLSVPVTAGHTYAFQLQAVDNVGNRSGLVATGTVKAIAPQESHETHEPTAEEAAAKRKAEEAAAANKQDDADAARQRKAEEEAIAKRSAEEAAKKTATEALKASIKLGKAKVTATSVVLTVTTSAPGTVTIQGRGLKKTVKALTAGTRQVTVALTSAGKVAHKQAQEDQD